MRDAPRTINWKPQVLIWKYILFEFNDSDKEIQAAQELAQRLRVDLLFVCTHSAGRSRRYTPENLADLTRYFPQVITNATPIHYRQSQRPASQDRTLCVVDRLHWDVDGALELVGWALSHDKLTAILVTLDGHVVAEAMRDLPRPDVFAVHPTFGETRAGFEFHGMVHRPSAGRHGIGLTLLTGDTVLQQWHAWHDVLG
jgi:hypothetical protein